MVNVVRNDNRGKKRVLIYKWIWLYGMHKNTSPHREAKLGFWQKMLDPLEHHRRAVFNYNKQEQEKGIYFSTHRQKEIAPSLPILVSSVWWCALLIQGSTDSWTSDQRFPSYTRVSISQTHASHFNMTGSKLMLTLRLFLTFIVILSFKKLQKTLFTSGIRHFVAVSVAFCRIWIISLFSLLQIHWKFPQALILGIFY